MIESGVSKSTHPSFVCSIWAAGLNFLLVLFRGYKNILSIKTNHLVKANTKTVDQNKLIKVLQQYVL